MAPPPLAQRQQHRLQAEAQQRGGILHARRHLGKDLAMNQPVFLQLAELLDQHLLRNAGEQAVKFREAPGSVEQMTGGSPSSAPK